MSALVDIWTSEMRKLREKGQTTHHQSTTTHHQQPSDQSNPTDHVRALFNRLKFAAPPPVLPSEPMAEMCTNQLSKLKEKIGKKNGLIVSIAKEPRQMGVSEKPAKLEDNTVVRSDIVESPMSETTLCLLMDRFVPC